MMKRRIIFLTLTFLVLSFLVGTLLGALMPVEFELFGPSKEEVAKEVKKLYELANPGAQIEIVTTLEESGLYKIVLKSTGPTGITYREAYVTKDGKLLTENVILVKESTKQIQMFKDFVDCLDEKGVKIYGLNNSTATLLQLNILGRYSGKLYVSCDGANLQTCLNAGIQQIPSVVYNNDIYPGVKTIDWFAQQTGCKFG
jgi:hypothetical protein